MTPGEIVIAAAAIIVGARLLSQYFGRERHRPMLPGDWIFGEVIELPAAAQNDAGGGRTGRSDRLRIKDEIAPHRKDGL